MNKGTRIFLLTLISALTALVIFTVIYVPVYYNVLNPEHTGIMRWPHMVLVVASVLGVFVALRAFDALERSKPDFDSKPETRIMKVVGFLGSIPFYILIFPLGIIVMFVIIFTHRSARYQMRFLKKHGFLLTHNRKTHERLWINENICIKESGDVNFEISFDWSTKKTFVRLDESEIGIDEERKSLAWVMHEYKNAPPVDIQRGDAPNVAGLCIEFIRLNIATILNHDKISLT